MLRNVGFVFWRIVLFFRLFFIGKFSFKEASCETKDLKSLYGDGITTKGMFEKLTKYWKNRIYKISNLDIEFKNKGIRVIDVELRKFSSLVSVKFDVGCSCGCGGGSRRELVRFDLSKGISIDSFYVNLSKEDTKKLLDKIIEKYIEIYF